MHLAAKLGRPVVLIHGDEETSTSDLVGAEHGYSMRRVLDNFIHSVLKAEEEVTVRWVDNRLTTAAKHGFTLIYDEFTRSRPEANNVLLAVFQERMLDIPGAGAGDGEDYVRVHPNFACIFTSNPQEYAGTYRSQDALLDRMVTIDLGFFDEEDEVAVTAARSGLEYEEARRLVSLVRGLRDAGCCPVQPTLRNCIKAATAVRLVGASISADDTLFRAICGDILVSGTTRTGQDEGAVRAVMDRLIEEKCSPRCENEVAV
jgi:gas vesicle protein GvpN